MDPNMDSMLGLEFPEGFINQEAMVRPPVEKLIELFKLNGMYDQLTLEMAQEAAEEMRALCAEIEAIGALGFIKKHSPENTIDDFSGADIAEANAFIISMYRSLVTLYDRICEEKSREGRSNGTHE